MSLFNRRNRLDEGKVDGIDLGGLGTIAGGVGGFMLGGPAGAALGATLGGTLDGGLKGGTQTTSSEFNSSVKPYIEAGLADFTQVANTTPRYFGAPTVADQSETTLAGLGEMKNGVYDMQSYLAGQGNAGLDFTLNSMLDPSSNTALQGYINSAINPIYERLENTTLPGIGTEAVMAGQFGSPQQYNLQREAMTDANRVAGEITSNIASNAYQQSLDNYTNTLLNIDKFQQNAALPAQTLLNVGGIEEAYSQRLLDDKVARHNFERDANFNRLQSYLSTLMQVPMNQTVQGADTHISQVGASLAPYLMMLQNDGGSAGTTTATTES